MHKPNTVRLTDQELSALALALDIALQDAEALRDSEEGEDLAEVEQKIIIWGKLADRLAMWGYPKDEGQSMKYLATMDLYGRQAPVNHGRVEIDDAGFLSDGTPVEDYGMYIIRDKPLPTCPKKLTRMFMWLLRDRTTPED